MKARFLIPAIIPLLIVSLATQRVALSRSQGDSRTFPQTGKAVSGKFLQYWDAHGGLAQQGYPISDEMQEVSDTDGKTYTVQYFERAVFEMHPENAPPNDVLLSLLGRFLYKQKYPDGAPGQTPNTSDGSRLFPETGKRLGGVFLAYWDAHGGLAQQGYPISDEFEEVSALNGQAYRVQYFERAVFEYHAENQPPYDVLLSQLGTFRYKARYQQPQPTAEATATPAPTSTPAPPVVDFVAEITGEPNHFMQPNGIAAARDGTLYVVDSLNNRVQKFASDGRFLLMWGSTGSGDGQFEFRRHPENGLGGVAVDEQGNVYVADSMNNRVQKFTADGSFVLKWGSKGDGDGQFLEAFDVAVDRLGNVYVIDDVRNDIQKFDPQGRLLLKWGGPGSADGQMLDVGGLAVDSQGNVYVADAGNNRIQKFGPGGEFLQKWGRQGKGTGLFTYPNDLAVDYQDNVYVADTENHRIQTFDANGTWLGMWGSMGSGQGQFAFPVQVAGDEHGNVYVSDYDNNRVQVFHWR